MATKFFSLEEISKNNGRSGNRFWMVIKDSVYDATDYVDEHPGGREHIEEAAGKDATKDFNDVGHSGDAKEVLKKYKIGEVREEDRKHPVHPVERNGNGRSFWSYLTCGLCD